MILKFIDAKGCTHYRECREVTYIGYDVDGHDNAVRYDGVDVEILHYDGHVNDAGDEWSYPNRYFVVYPMSGPRQIIACHMQGGWLMVDGKTVDNLLFLNETVPAKSMKEMVSASL